jgi:hypothetical protein
MDFLLVEKKLFGDQHGFLFFFLDSMLKKTFSGPTWIFLFLFGLHVKKNF